MTDADKIPEEVAWHLQRCDGFLDLKMCEAARRELETIPEAHRSTELYRLLEMRLAMDTKSWSRAAEIVLKMKEVEPNEPAHWINLAYAVRRAVNLEAARPILVEAEKRFPKQPQIAFNLACYECQLGLPTEAKDHLSKAFRMEAKYRLMAEDDEDLEPIWDDLDGIK